MAWTCPECGLAEIADADTVCRGCGYRRLGRVVLVSETTGKQIDTGVDIEVTVHLLQTLGDEDARFASPFQFVLARDVEKRAWTIRHRTEARNPTYLNGSPLPASPVPLTEEDRISIGPEKLPLRVKLPH